MAVLSESDLSENLKKSWLKAMSAMQTRNYGYAVQLYSSIVKLHPEFLAARQLARKAAIAIEKTTEKKTFLGMTLSGKSSFSGLSGMKFQSLVKKDPVAAMNDIEKELEKDPCNLQLNTSLHDAALALKLPDIAEFALETITEGNPKDSDTLHKLAKLYLENGKSQQSLDTYNRILQFVPNDMAAVKGSKDAAAALSMQRGGWDRKDTDYRDFIKDKDATIEREQSNRIVRSDEMIDNLISDFHEKLQAQPENLDVARRIAELYEQKEDLDNAIAWYQYTNDLARSTDPNIVRKISDLRLKQIDKYVEGTKRYIVENPSAEDLDTVKNQLAEVQKQRTEHLLGEAQKRVDRNPTDQIARYELGEILVQLGQYREAIAELQKARVNPSVRLRSMNLLGRCYTERKMFDLAADTLNSAVNEIGAMDSTKKSLLYDLGLVYEKMGNKEKALDALKQIYAVDYDYRDVAARVEGSYE